MSKPQPRCPIRDQEPCTLCHMGVSGPQDCGLVYLVMDDPEMRELWQANRLAHRREQAAGAARTA
ncbi:DUF6767 domain-containing protein [Luteococcus peritonei]|uniref:DUF6767 domain-containing protein n=1 Tax=Luteococcus peritonei TaxID=88874 RepID=A0ABW4RVR2_9ACTN